MFKHLVLCSALMAAGWAAHASAACSSATGESARARLTSAVRTYAALSDGWIESSRFQAGQIVPAGQAVVRLNNPALENQINVLLGKVTELELKKLDLANIGMLNRASLADYEREHGVLAPDVRRRVVRADERELLDRNLRELRQQIQRLQRQAGQTAGRLPYPVLLLATPAREGETVQAGSTLFEYSPLDQLQLAVFPAPGRSPAARVQLPLGHSCVNLQFVRTWIDPKNQTPVWTYQGQVAPTQGTDLARLLLNPAPWLTVVLQGGAP